MPETREDALNDVRAALERLVDADSVLAVRIAAAMDRACESLTLEPAAEYQPPSPEALAKVTRDLAFFARCLPVALEGSTLVVLAAEPIDLLALRMLEAEVGSVRVVSAPAQAIWQGLIEAYGQPPMAKKKKGAKSKDPVPEQDMSPIAEVAEPIPSLEPEQDMSPIAEVAETIPGAQEEPEIADLVAAKDAEAISPETAKPPDDHAPVTEGDIAALFASQESDEPAQAEPEVESPQAVDDEDAAVTPDEIAALLAAQAEATSQAALGADDIAALFSAAEASAQPVDEPAQVGIEDQFAELLAEVQTKEPETADTGDLTAPRTQNLDLLSAFQGVDEVIPLDVIPKPSDPSVPMHMLELGKEPEPEAEKPDESVEQQLERLNRLLAAQPECAADPALSEKVPLATALAAMCAPVAIDGDDLVCLILDPPNMEAAEEVARSADMALRLQLGSREEVLQVLHGVYGEFKENEFLAALALKEPPASGGLLGKLKSKFKKAA